MCRERKMHDRREDVLGEGGRGTEKGRCVREGERGCVQDEGEEEGGGERGREWEEEGGGGDVHRESNNYISTLGTSQEPRRSGLLILVKCITNTIPITIATIHTCTSLDTHSLVYNHTDNLKEQLGVKHPIPSLSSWPRHPLTCAATV